MTHMDQSENWNNLNIWHDFSNRWLSEGDALPNNFTSILNHFWNEGKVTCLEVNEIFFISISLSLTLNGCYKMNVTHINPKP